MRLPKSLTALMFAFILMFSNVGLALNVRFCGDEQIASTVIYAKVIEDSCEQTNIHKHVELEENCHKTQICCGESTDDHSDCCKDHTITQDNPDLLNVKSFSFSYDAFVLTENDYSVVFFTTSEDSRQDHFDYCFQSNAPPLYKLYCSLIYYA
jgi:hypothetical protein